ncbi:helix-turn-helix transcriptional regulator [Morganella morganii]|uniref:XRE family transcriptional regulator n=1 Tax=Morganella morganii TaxID=582 RepID=A0AAU8ZRS0_MORMO|nr:helix-turn-helix transcriptional regulator [Morganella morganii]AWC92310.1 XRE family transcriptional regulator [Morganella morganii]AWC94962.1 XRE family transcriptional regulator [Morganella morganii]HAT3624841.1 helix-turn-helix transcriptional regulator [Morganella morganii]HAT3767119.1 helix-turn-helix transcriptional regulator [Morganella morganii]
MKKTKNHVSASVGRKIRETRKSVGISANALAPNLGLSQQQISRYENGRTSMTIDTVVMIARQLDVSVNDLLSDYLTSEDNHKIITEYHCMH